MNYLFIVTYGRSGSTVLQNSLNALDGYCIRGENFGALNHLALSINSLAKTHEQMGAHGSLARDPWYGADKIDVSRARYQLTNDFVDSVLSPPPDTRVTGFKEIRYTPNELTDQQYHCVTNFLFSAFPGSRVILNTRNANEVARSGWWAKRELNHVLDLIALCDARFEQTNQNHPDRSILIDYSEYNNRPEGMDRLFDWLGSSETDRSRGKAASSDRLTHMKAKRKWRFFR